MTRNQLSDEYTTADVVDQFNVEDDDLPDNVGDIQLALAAALNAIDGFTADDPTKFEAMQNMVRAMAGLDDIQGRETTVITEMVEVTEEFNGEKFTTEVPEITVRRE